MDPENDHKSAWDIAVEQNEKRYETERREPAGSGSMQRAGSVPGIIFAVSNDGGKTGVAWRENVHDAMAYLDLQNVGGRGYCVVAVRKAQNAPDQRPPE
jgi:hypothetical protein